ncbi:recombinase family protein [Nocardia halotolerans]|uniref:Recombinase family protein n=1 Tax=Nocardia halotolerans TaxID=1755878 RepID=A0ABV8VLR3_9NOCA
MTLRPTAIGYLRTDVSGARQSWDEIRMRSLAGRLGYNLAKIITFSGRTDHPMDRLIAQARRANAEMVLVPNEDHLGDSNPERLHRITTVITLPDEY